jgi:hypothetical protein
MTANQQNLITFTIQRGDVMRIGADVLALKYAQELYGVDANIVAHMQDTHPDILKHLPKPSDFYITKSRGAVAADSIIFIGVPILYRFGYQQIREFARKVLASLSSTAPDTCEVLVTLHGAGYGLDELEAFSSEIAGFVDAIVEGNYPASLRAITLVELSRGRTDRLKAALNDILPNGGIPLRGIADQKAISHIASERLRSAGYNSESKPRIFVAMPFANEMEDVFHYGIQGAANAAGFLCERADMSSFTGDIVQWVKQRIESASLVIADLTTANPNVYLEVGYAWGCRRPTVLLVKDATQLKFDVKGQRCLVYNSILDLEKALTKELTNLGSNLGLPLQKEDA